MAAQLSASPAEVADQLFARWNRPESPGCAAGVMLDGKVVLERGYGLANLEHAIPITAQTRFYLGSTSKEFTALTVLLLAGRGRLHLEDSVRKHLPGLPAFYQPVTIRHLLEHTSGARDYIGLWTIQGGTDEETLSDEFVFDLIARQKKLQFVPGDEFLYSNSGYFLLAQLVRPVAMRPFPLLAEELVFAPLGLKNTLYYLDHTVPLPKRATGHSPAAQNRYRLNSMTLDIGGDGGVFTTLEDTLAWLRVLEAPEGPYAAAIAQMRTPARLNGGDSAEYGRGLMLRPYKGVPAISHAGGLRGYRSEILWIPSRRFAAVCLCNTSDVEAPRMARLLADAYLALPDPPAAAVAQASLERKAGVFRDLDSGDILQIGAQNGQLTADYTGFQFVLRAETPMRFRSVNAPIDFQIEFRDAGRQDEPRFLRVESETHKPARYERVTLATAPPSNPREYEGEYLSEEAKARVRVAFREGHLHFEQNGRSVGNLQAIVADRFRLSNLNVEFVRDAEKRISGLRLNTGRVRGLEFRRAPR